MLCRGGRWVDADLRLLCKEAGVRDRLLRSVAVPRAGNLSVVSSLLASLAFQQGACLADAVVIRTEFTDGVHVHFPHTETRYMNVSFYAH